MAVTFHNATVTAGPASVGTATILHTVSGADACLLVFTHANTAVSFSAMAANGFQLTRLGHISASSSRAEVWGLSNAPIATLSISANVVGAASLNFCLVAVSYRGQRQFGGSPFGTVVAGSAQGVANTAFSVSSTSTDLVVYGFGISANTTITVTTGNSRGNTTHTTTGRLVVGDITGAATISISATAATAGTWSFLGVPIVASAAAATTSIRFDNAAWTATTTAKNSIGMLLTATSNAVLLVWTHVGGGSQTISAVVAGTSSLTRVGDSNYWNGAQVRAELWVLTAPPTGILTISAVIVSGLTTSMGLGGVTYTGHKTTATPFGGVVSASASTVAEAQLVISSTVGNVVVFGWGFNNAGSSTAIGMPVRVDVGLVGSPGFGVAEQDGLTNVTAIARANGSANWGLIGINLIQSGAATVVTGRLSATEAADTFSASGYAIVSGRLSATETTDKFSATGYVIVSGRLSATGAADRLSATGYVLVSGRLSATGAADTFSASGYVIVSGRMSATDAADIFSASGYVVNTANVNGRLSATEAGDTFSASGYVIVSGSVNFTDRPDTLSVSGTVIAVSTPAAVVTPDTSSIGGKKDKKTEYFRADDAFWEAREKYLLSLQPALSATAAPVSLPVATVPATAPSPVDPSLLVAYRATRTKLVNSIPAASSMRQLKAQGKRLYEVNAKIAEAKRQGQLRAAAVLARLQREERQAKRAASIKRIKRRVIILAAARAAVALTYLIDKL